MKGKKLIALVLCLLLTISLLPVSALAEGDGEEPAQPVDTTPPTAETDPGEAPQGDAKDNETTPPADDGDDTTPPVEDGDVLLQTGEPAGTDGETEGGDAPDDDETEILGGTRDTLTDGFYLIGPNWTVDDIDADNKFSINTNNTSEYMLQTTLTQGQKLKVVKVESGAITAWYPGGYDNEYTVDASHAGSTTIYFQETYKSDWSGFGGYFYIPEQQQVTRYAVNIRTISPSGAGTVTASPTSAAQGETVTLTITENTGYRLSSNSPTIWYNQWYQLYQMTQVDRLTYTFTMPAYPVDVDVVFNVGTTLQISMIDTTNGQQQSNACGTVTVEPTVGFQGDTVRATITVNEGYRLDPSWTTSWTLISQSGNVFVYDVPVGPNGVVSIYFDQHIYEGYYLRLSDADEDYTDWTCLSQKLVQGDPTFISNNNDVFYHAKVQLTVGQLLRVYHLSYSGNQLQGTDTPVASYTVTSDDVVSGQLSTVYLKYAATGSQIGVSALDGYYLVFTYPLPYNVQAKHKLTLQNGVYVNDGYYQGEDRVRVALYSEGTVVHTFMNGRTNNVDYYQVPREPDGENQYDGPGGFPRLTTALGRAYFLPDGSGDATYAGGYLKIRRLYTFEFDWNYDEINHADVVIASSLGDDEYAAGGETISFEIEPIEGYVVSNVTIIKLTDETAVSCEEEAGVYTFTMPADDVFIYITFAPEPEETGHTVIVMQPLLAQHGICGISPNGGENIDAGIPVTVTFTPDEGFAVDYVTSNVSDKDAPVDVTAALVNNVYTFTMPDWSVVIEVHWKEAEPVDDAEFSASLYLKDNININLYISNVSAEEIGNYTIKVKTYHKDADWRVIDNTNPNLTSSGYKYTLVELFSFQMTYPVEIQVLHNGQVVFDRSQGSQHGAFSAQEYLGLLYDYVSSWQDLVVATLNYGTQAQTYFNGKTYVQNGQTYSYDTYMSNLANSLSQMEGKREAYLNYAQPDLRVQFVSEDIEGVSDIGISLVLGTETTIKIQFTYTGNVSDLTATCSGGKTASIVDEGNGKYSIRVPMIKCYELGKLYTFTLTDTAGNTTSIKASAYDYINLNWASQKLGNLVKALYAYGIEADKLW